MLTDYPPGWGSGSPTSNWDPQSNQSGTLQPTQPTVLSELRVLPQVFFLGKTLKHFFISAILQKKIARFVFNGSRLRTFVADFWLDTWCENDRLHDRFARPTQERSHWWGRNAPLYICPFLQVALVPLPPAHGQAP